MRAAVVHAFNAPAMVDSYFLGTTKPTTDLYFGGSTGFTFTRHDTKKIDALLEQARAEADAKKRGGICCQIEQVVSDDAIALIPVRQTYYAVSHPYVKDVPPMQDNILRSRAIWLGK